ncbi:MAG: 6,7-dimethyl-8-ribityllumazine synthase [Succinivibrionaceae bacterium]|nr:6,7-dimethyl-8-ribityllumazine synthase [Succinivibrionaceae bacterium]
MAVKMIEGNRPCPEGNFAILVSRFNSFITNRLLEGALDTLRREGAVDDGRITVIKVPGAIELPVIAQKVAETGKYDAIIALGCVIRGDTYHFEVVANECSKGLTEVSLKYGVPVALGVITTNNLEQAVQRAGNEGGNKGSEAASSALEMVNVVRQI